MIRCHPKVLGAKPRWFIGFREFTAKRSSDSLADLSQAKGGSDSAAEQHKLFDFCDFLIAASAHARSSGRVGKSEFGFRLRVY